MEKDGLQVLVVGLGSIGGTLSGLVREAEVPGVARIVGWARNPELRAALQDRGFVLGGLEPRREIPADVVGDLAELDGSFDFVVLAVPPTAVEAAAESTVHLLAPRGAMVCLQNGLCEARVAKIAGPERVLGAVVAWGAESPEPGDYRRTAQGGFYIGRLDGEDDPRLLQLATLLAPVGPVELTTNLAGARWSKLALNSVVSTLGTIGGDRLGVLMRLRVVRRLALEIISETVAVAGAEGVRLEKVAGALDLPWLALTPAERASSGSASLVAKHSLLLAVGARYRRMRSSMLYALERGHEPPVDFLNGEVVAAGERLGVPTPVNHLAWSFVKEMARGERSPGHDQVRELGQQVGLRV